MNLLRLAWRNIQRNRRRSRVTVLIASVGAASILISSGFALYTYNALRDAAARESGHLTAAHREYFQRDEETPLQWGLDDHAALAARLKADPQVTRVLPRLAFSGLVSNGEKSMIFMGHGVDIGGETAARGQFLKLLEGSLPADAAAAVDSPQVLLGKDLARSLGAKPGSGLTLLGTTTAGSLNAIDVQVAGLVSTGVPDVDKRLVFSDLAAAQRLLATDKVSTLAVFLNDSALTAPLLETLRRDDPAHAWQPWWDQAFYYTAVRGLYNRIFGLLGIIIGALPKEIVAQFVAEGALIGGLGAAMGMAVAAAASATLQVAGLQMPPPPGRSDGYPLLVNISPTLYAFTVVAIVLLCAAAAWIVSRKAAAKPIVEALGHV
jgi:putative ABC transport system permease protein